MDQPTPNAPNSNQPAFPAARHIHTEGESAGGTMDMDFKLIATVAAASVLLVLTIVLLTQAWFQYEVNLERNTSRKLTVNPELQSLQEKQLANINSYRWVDSNHQIVRLPIERAMAVTIERNRKPQDAKSNAGHPEKVGH